jgi:hypothetical protein
VGRKISISDQGLGGGLTAVWVAVLAADDAAGADEAVVDCAGGFVVADGAAVVVAVAPGVEAFILLNMD